MATNPADGTVLGTLYGSDAMRAVFAERQWLQYMLDVEAALARAQARLGIVPTFAANAIAAAARADKLDLKELAAGTRVTGYPVVALTRALAHAAGPKAGGYVHWGATTQDIMDTALVLQIRAGLAIVESGVARVGRALAARAVKHRRDAMAGRSHLQHALPVTYGYKCAVWTAPLIGDTARLQALRGRVLKVQFAGAAGTLASLGSDGRAVTEGLARELGLAVPDAPWHVARDTLAETASVLGILCGNLAKFATDIVLLMQTEVAEVFEPHIPGRGGSSTMPQKRNPIASEYVLAASRGVQSLVPLMLGAMAQDHERSTGPWQTEALALPQIFVLTGGALEHAAAIAEGMTVDAARMRRNLDLTRGLIMTEAIMMALAPRIGREAAHHAVAHACNRALDKGVTLAAALQKEPALKGRIDAAALKRLVDPKGYLGEADAVVTRISRAARAVWGTAAKEKRRG